ncbi:DUF4352 domain-containing protein [Streptomyces sp. NPDC051555]|uniref:DUF4352 domain-containing protein n=1 Tax=Streptomyces sp. NPDC051555 TaxID=3365657 RepID=UPI0037873941
MRRLWPSFAAPALTLTLALTLALAAPTLLGAGPGPGVAEAQGRLPAGPTGETISLRGNGPGELLDVTLVAVTDPATPRTADPARDPAQRLVSVEFRLVNTGTAAYTDAPRDGSYLLDLGGKRYSGVARATTAGTEFPDGHSLAPGDRTTGSVTFELPRDARPSAVQFALNGGTADDIGQWPLS